MPGHLWRNSRSISLATLRHKTIQDFLTDTLRSRIVSGELPAGTRIDQDALAAEFSISRMPVREALRALDAEGFVTLKPHRGAVVSSLSPTEVDEIYQMRAVLEGLASRLALTHLTESHFAQLEALLNTMSSTSDVHKWVRCNAEFHGVIEEACGRSRLLELIVRLRHQTESYVRMYVHLLHGEERAITEHRRIVDACLRGDEAAVEASVREHLLNTGVGVVAHLKRTEADAEETRSRDEDH
jgi:DNA-binding GntR family transcriptional regulator